jgi:hypothetical protein
VTDRTTRPRRTARFRRLARRRKSSKFTGSIGMLGGLGLRSARPSLHVEMLEERCLLSASGSEVPWLPVDLDTPSYQVRDSYLRAAEFESFTIDRGAFDSLLQSVPLETESGDPVELAIPTPDGSLEWFEVLESPVMAPELAEKYPQIRTYGGRGINDPSATVRLDVTPAGVHVQVLSPMGSYYVDPIFHLDDSAYASYSSDVVDVADTPIELLSGVKRPADQLHRRPLVATPGDVGTAVVATSQITASSSGSELRVFRAAVAAVGEYTTFHGGTVAQGLGAIVTVINRINGIYEKELSIRLQLVANNDRLVYTNAFSDPYSNGDAVALTAQNQSNVDSVIGIQNYDIGHVFATSGGGLASLGSVGVDNPISPMKARGVSGIPQPTGDRFTVDFVAHEMGHQFAANHTWNGDSGACGSGDHTPSTAFEPGSGSTIMGYAGICGNDNLQPFSDPFFHSISFDEIIHHADEVIPSVGARTPTGNSIPVVSAGSDFTMPANTPFALTATGEDQDATDVLTYSWEQRDVGPRQDLNAPDNAPGNGSGPLFRARPPSAEPTRVFPRLAELLNNTTAIGERLPTVDRTMNFRVTVRDNRAEGGGVSADDMVLNVVETGSSFRVTSPNTGAARPARSVQTVTWDVAGTNANGIDTGQVNILLSMDGGLTFPVPLAFRTPNDGSEAIVLPDVLVSQARIKIEAVGNVFFDISDASFAITSSAPGIVAITTGGGTFVSEGGVTDQYELSLNSAPSGNVVVSVGTSSEVEVSVDGAAFVSTLDLTFSSTDSRTVVVRALDDTTFDGIHFGTITHAVSETGDIADYPTTLEINHLTVNVADNELAPARRIGPDEALIFVSDNESYLSSQSDVQDFSVMIEAGQTAAAHLEPLSNEQLTVELVGVSGPVTSGAAGSPVTLPPSMISESGFYTLRVRGSGPSPFKMRYLGNAALEDQVGDTSEGLELDITNSFLPLGSGRFAVLGTFSASQENSAPKFDRFNDPTRFVDISTTGNALNLSDEDLGAIVTTIGNAALPSGTISVANNGVIFPGDIFDVPFQNTPLPTVFLDRVLVPFWDDLGDGSGNVYWQERQIDGIDALVVQWENRPHFDFGGAATFQVQVFQTGPVLARYVYQDVQFGNSAVDFGASATVGYQSSSGSATQFSFSSPSLADGDVLDLALPTTSDVDQYLIDLTGLQGRTIDIALGSSDGVDLTEQSLELIDRDGTTVLAEGVSDPVQPGTDAVNHDLSILGFVVPADGLYTLRATSTRSAEYAIVVTESLTLDTEPNDSDTDPLRSLNTTGAALGFLGSGDLGDLYRFDLAAGDSLLVSSETPLDRLPAINTLDPALEIIDPNGTTVVASDLDAAADGKNAIASVTAAQAGSYFIRVGATSGHGAYLLKTLTAEITPTVTLSVDVNNIAEAAGVVTVTATLSAATAVPVTIDFAFGGTAAPSDYSASNTQIVIAPGFTTGAITVTAVQDELDEPDETVTVGIDTVLNGTESQEQTVTVAILDDDVPTGLVVTSFIPSSSGFVAEFSDDLDTAVLNLYETQAAVFDPADVRLTGLNTGPVDGSLVVDASLRTITFLKTADVLVADTYSVTLRSASDGFRDGTGRLLDGDADGTAGDDFETTFSVAEPEADAVIIGLPDIVRGPGQEINVPADVTTGIPLTISNGSNVRAIDLRVSYDPQLLTITGATVGEGLPSGGSVILNNAIPGLAIVVFFSATPLSDGPAVFANLQATVPSNAASEIYGRQEVLDVHAVAVSDGSDNEFPVVVDDAVHLATFFGDVSGNGMINAGDAAQVASVAAELHEGFAASSLTDPLLVGDISGNGRINATDASRVALFAALFPVAQIPPLPSVVVIASSATRNSRPLLPPQSFVRLGVAKRPQQAMEALLIEARPSRGSMGAEPAIWRVQEQDRYERLVDRLVEDDELLEDLLAALEVRTNSWQL